MATQETEQMLGVRLVAITGLPDSPGVTGQGALLPRGTSGRVSSKMVCGVVPVITAIRLSAFVGPVYG